MMLISPSIIVPCLFGSSEYVCGVGRPGGVQKMVQDMLVVGFLFVEKIPLQDDDKMSRISTS